MGVHGALAVTAVTAQNTTEVRATFEIPAEMVRYQVAAVLDDLDVTGVKTGMLANASIVSAVSSMAAEGALPNLVVDPVMVSSTGHRLLTEAAVATYIEELIPHAVVLTPNLDEAAVLTGCSPEDLASVEAMTGAAEQLAALGARIVVVKGGHLLGDQVVDVIRAGGKTLLMEAARVSTKNTHGSGCTLSAAIAALLAKGLDPLIATKEAIAFVRRAVAYGASWRLGAGQGPLDHFGWSACAAKT